MLGGLFQEQQSLITEVFKKTGSGGAIVENPMILMLWGILYYTFYVILEFIPLKIKGTNELYIIIKTLQA